MTSYYFLTLFYTNNLVMGPLPHLILFYFCNCTAILNLYSLYRIVKLLPLLRLNV
jgi:hypothetical protein